MSASLAAALAYAAYGWPVHPLRPGQKVPSTARGFKDATVDPERLAAWWTRHPDHNVGLATGGAFDVVDVDNCDAADRVQELAGPNWPTGPVVLTPRGWHVYVVPTGRGNAAGIIPGLDYRGRGGYVVAPPSVVRDVTYIWSPAFPPTLPLPPCPEWLSEMWDNRHQRAAPGSHVVVGNGHRTSGYGRRALESEIGRLALTPEGGRNDELVRASYRLGQLVAAGELDAAEVAGALLAVAERIGLCDAEASATIASGMRAGMQSPRPARSNR